MGISKEELKKNKGKAYKWETAVDPKTGKPIIDPKTGRPLKMIVRF